MGAAILDNRVVLIVAATVPVGPSVVAKLDPADYNNSLQNTEYVDMTVFAEAMFIVLLGAVDSTINFKLRQANLTNGTGEIDMPGKAITQMTVSSKQAVIHVKASELTGAGRYIRGRLTVGNNFSNVVSVVALGFSAVYTLGQNDLASVVQVVGGT